MEIQFAQMLVATILSVAIYRKAPSFPPALHTAKPHDAPLARLRERGWGRGKWRESSGFSELTSTPLDSRLRGNDDDIGISSQRGKA
jgi:hypothetical protein